MPRSKNVGAAPITPKRSARRPLKKSTINLYTKLFIILIPLVPISLECFYLGSPTDEIILVTAIICPITVAVSEGGILFIVSILNTLVFSTGFGVFLKSAFNTPYEPLSLKMKILASLAIICISVVHIVPLMKKIPKRSN